MSWITGVVRLVPLVVAAVNAIERLGKGKGKEKQDAAVDLVGDLLPLVEGTIGRDALDDSAVQTALRAVIDAVVALQNVVATAKARRAD